MEIIGDIFTHERTTDGKFVFPDKEQFKIFCESVIKNDRKRTIKIINDEMNAHPFGNEIAAKMIENISNDEINP